MLTQEILKQFVHYDPESGFMTRTNAYHKSKIGKVASSRNKKGHIQMQVGGFGNYLVHRLAWLYVYGAWPKNQIDHIDGDKSNNRIANLRDVTNSENSQNRYGPTSWNKSSRLLGVTFHKKTGKWMAAIRKGNLRKHIGLFQNAEDAHAAYLKEKAILHPYGEIAKEKSK